MTTTTERKTETAADQLHRCIGWIDDHAAHEVCDSIHQSRCGDPYIYLRDLAALKLLFPGATATKERSGSQWRYKLAADGIRFESWEWIEESPAAETEVTL